MNNERTKKILIILGFGLAVIVIAFTLWAVFFKTPEEEVSVDGVQTELPGSTTLPTRADAGTAQIIDSIEQIPVSPVARGSITETEVINLSGSVAPAMGSDGKSVAFLNSNDGRFYRVNNAGNVVQMSDKQFFGVEDVHWSGSRNKTIMEFPDGSNVMFDFNKQEQVTLPKHWDSFDFAPKSDELATMSLGDGPENSWLITANADGSSARAIEHVGKNADKVTVSYSPNNQTIAFSDTGAPAGGERRNILLIGKEGENLPALTVDGGGFQPNWAPDGNKLLYSTYHSNDQYNPRLWVVSGQGNDIGSGKKDLGLNTWAEKCTYADDTTLYCAVPDKLEPGLGLEPELADYIPDTIYKVDVNTGAKSVVGKPVGNFSISTISVDKNQGSMFITDATTGALHKMKLK